jgi:hypothetical protein
LGILSEDRLGSPTTFTIQITLANYLVQLQLVRTEILDPSLSFSQTYLYLLLVPSLP